MINSEDIKCQRSRHTDLGSSGGVDRNIDKRAEYERLRQSRGDS
jgi:hypothetical protein